MFEITTLDTRPEFKDKVLAMSEESWPRFMLQWECPHWARLFSDFSDHQVVVHRNDELVAFGHSISLRWDGETESVPDDLKILIDKAVEDRERRLKPNLLLALAVVVESGAKGGGLSSKVLERMKGIADSKGIGELIVPVRPTMKTKYPLVPIEEYSRWIREDGQPFDPWLRVHTKLGGAAFKTTETSMAITGRVGDWETWTGLRIPGGGAHIIEGGLSPLAIDIDKDVGVYHDPCIWVRYRL